MTKYHTVSLTENQTLRANHDNTQLNDDFNQLGVLSEHTEIQHLNKIFNRIEQVTDTLN